MPRTLCTRQLAYGGGGGRSRGKGEGCSGKDAAAGWDLLSSGRSGQRCSLSSGTERPRLLAHICAKHGQFEKIPLSTCHLLCLSLLASHLWCPALSCEEGKFTHCHGLSTNSIPRNQTCLRSSLQTDGGNNLIFFPFLLLAKRKKY